MNLVVDTSALVASLLGEPGAGWLDEQLQDADRAIIAAPTAVELGIVLARRFPTDTGLADAMLRRSRIGVTPFDEDLATRAIGAFLRYGKDRDPAALNFGDCCTYALAEQTGYPILCVGEDFARTDLPVLRPPT